MKVAITILTTSLTPETEIIASQLGSKKNKNGEPLFDVWVVSDNPIEEPTDFENFNIIHVPDETSKNNGYINCVSNEFTHIKKNPTAWDKCLYAFNTHFSEYQFVWILEDDVFMLNADVMVKLHEKYNEYDLVTANNIKTPPNQQVAWHWEHIHKSINAPYYTSMSCAIGVSRRLLNEIELYVEKHKSLFFNEAMFNTLAFQAGLKIMDAVELKSIVWMGDWNVHIISKLPNNLFHPIKGGHEELRKEMKDMFWYLEKKTVTIPLFLRK